LTEFAFISGPEYLVRVDGLVATAVDDDVAVDLEHSQPPG